MKLRFSEVLPPKGVSSTDWLDWRWQMRQSLKSEEDFAQYFELTSAERQGFALSHEVFQIRTTPYYARVADALKAEDPIRRMMMPHARESMEGSQQMLDPLGEKRHSPVPRLIHRYPDRVLFLVTDLCSVYCRFCTRKHFTGQDQARVRDGDYERALEYLRGATGVREVILSGGDPLTLGDAHLEQILSDLRSIEHIEIIRLGTRMPVVCPMRVTTETAQLLRRFAPVYLMTHFNHPRELTAEAATCLSLLVDNGVPVFNQMVLLNGINNHPAIVQALSRRLLYLRVKPYYMFQVDPSLGTDHFRTSIENSLWIQRELWGRMSGLAMPNLSLDIPGGGGKVGLTPDFTTGESLQGRSFKGWDGFEADYINPKGEMEVPSDVADYFAEWESLKNQTYGS